MGNILKKIFGTSSQKELKAIEPLVKKIEALEEPYKALTDAELRGKTDEFKERLGHGETLDDILPEAFAVCREASWRVLGMRPYRVQLIGGIILHQGRIAEMKTGEGKTLVATLPAYLNALAGEGVHIVTVNDYLAKRDSEWMGKVYRFLGLTVGLVIHDIQPKDRKASYAADITYGTNNEFGFDYLRDNMAIYKQEMVQRGHSFAIVDEVDSILIDEARTPLIISGQGDKSTQLYQVVDAFVSRLKAKKVASVDTKEEEDESIDADYVVDEKARTVTLTARGIEKAEKAFNIENLADPENTTLSHHINQAIRAWGLMRRDKDYVVKDGEVIIVDEFTGRLMYGRRYSEGLHQAIEAKEKVEAKVAELDIPWETDDYIPLPEWRPGVEFYADDPAYDIFPVYYTNASNTDTWTVQNAWLNEVNEEDGITYLIEMNTATAAEKGLARLMKGVETLSKLRPSEDSTVDPAELECRCREAMDDDLNSPMVISALFDWVRIVNQIAEGRQRITAADLAALTATVKRYVFDILGLRDEKAASAGGGRDRVTPLVEMLLRMRMEAKAAKDWATSDRIRDELTAIGIRVKDRKDGFDWEIE